MSVRMCRFESGGGQAFDQNRLTSRTMNALAYVFVTIAGALNAVQSGSNATLARSLGRPWLVGVLVSLITAAAMVIGVLVTGARMPEPGRFGDAPWWAWIGGLCGGAYVVSTLFFAGSMGAGLFTGLTIVAGIVASIAVDHFGLVGFQQHSASLLRIAGASLMIAGLVLVARF